MFIKTTIFIMDQGGTIERRVGELPAIVRPSRGSSGKSLKRRVIQTPPYR
jgi:hypothetical protein